jgi:DNA polymerase III epsilon subunit-like protein
MIQLHCPEAERMMTALTSLIGEISKRCPTNQFPSDYLVVDIETTGFNWWGKRGKDKPFDVVVQFGFAAVRDNEIVGQGCRYINPAPVKMHPDAARVTGLTDEWLAAYGSCPEDVYNELMGLIRVYTDSGLMIVGHNAYKFDIPFINADMKRLGVNHQFDPKLVLDTGMLFKAWKMNTSPHPDETLEQFFRRVAETWSRVKWNLATAMDELGLVSRFNIDLDDAHDASYDCWMTYLLLDTLRKQGDS